MGSIGIAYYILYISYGVLDMSNDILGYISIVKRSLGGITVFLIFELAMTAMAIAVFSPLVLFHLLIFTVTTQARNSLARVSYFILIRGNLKIT